MALRGSQPDRRHVWCPFPPRSYGRVLTVDERQHVRPSAVTDREIGRDTFVTAKVQDVMGALAWLGVRMGAGNVRNGFSGYGATQLPVGCRVFVLSSLRGRPAASRLICTAHTRLMSGPIAARAFAAMAAAALHRATASATH
jgi:hypothetical protein